MSYFSIRDLLKRWTCPPKGRGVYTRQGVYKIFRWPDFPAPAASDEAGETRLWRPADIEKLESRHPELMSDDAKRRKQRRAAIGNLKKQGREFRAG